MPELKHDFSQAKMNKDLDERIVPQGQYRDALNIQISTSDASNVGSAQTLLGNVKHNNMFANNGVISANTTSSVVAVVNKPETDDIFYFISDGDQRTSIATPAIRKDYIIKYNTESEKNTYVFVDIFSARTVTSIASSSSTTVVIPDLGVSTYNATGTRIGMRLVAPGITFEDNITITNIGYDSGNSRWNITVSEAVTISQNEIVTFRADRVLNFSKHRLITGVNVLDDFLFWTDNFSEPKKINIERSILGTGGDRHLNGGSLTNYQSPNPDNSTFTGDTPYFHTRLVTSEEGQYKVVTDTAVRVPVHVEEKHITVIRKAPTQPLTLKMFRSSDGDERTNSSGVENLPTVTTANNFQMGGLVAGSTLQIDGTNGKSFALPFDARVGDKLFFIDPDANDVEDDSSSDTFDEQSAQVIGIVTASLVTGPDNLFTTGFELEILSASPGYTTAANLWNVRRGDKDALFEQEFVRFSYRYKYEDGEYSPFAPFSEVAFLSDVYDYLPKKGFNLGMRNQLKALKLTDYYHKDGTRPEDVVEIDLLLKKTNNPTVYTIKTIKPTDEHPIWPDFATDANARGEYSVTTDMVHAVVPSNQLIRPYDNVPRQALAQEITANRLVYANYLQNFTVENDPLFRLNLHSINLENDEASAPSVKSIRKYQIGVVYSDEYGRETPVLTSKDAIIEVPKTAATRRNRLSCRLSSNTMLPDWAKYISYYVKETSSEYYSMAMDRWYEAADGNIWLSFPSSERNKMDEETFLLLKKAHGSDEPVTERARYKILAIENEAPDFIKTEKKSLGVLFDGGSNIGNSTRGWGGQDTLFITVESDAFEAVYGDDLHLTQYEFARIKVIFYGAGQRSEEYEVAKLSKLSNSYKLKFTTKIEEDAAFISTNDTYATKINDLSIELIGEKVENRPEFDGRFFVKIYRDEILERYILVEDEVDYFVRASWGLRYLNNHAYTNDSYFSGGEIKIQAKERTTNGSNSTLPHPTKRSHHASYNWDNIWSGSSAIGRRYAKVLNDDTGFIFSNEGKAIQFWNYMAGTQDFFIDAATAYSWTSKADSGQEDRPGNDYQSDVWSAGGVPKRSANNLSAEAGAPNGNTGNTRYEKGQPSRGIWRSGNLMDISWSGMGEGFDGNWNEKPFPHKLQDVPGDVYTNAAQFIAALCAPGAKFRFNKDPDETVYTVSSFADGMGTGVGYNNNNIFNPGTTVNTGVWGIRNTKFGPETPGNASDRKQYRGYNMRQRWTIRVSPAIGSGPSGYSPVKGTAAGAATSVAPLRHDATDQDVIELLGEYTGGNGKGGYTDNPAIWETEPKESVDVDIYYQASNLIPIELTEETNEEFLPIGSYFYLADSSGTETKHTITNWTSEDTFTFTPTIAANTTVTDDQHIHFYKRNNYWVGTNTNLSGNVTSGTSLTIHGTKDSPIDKRIWSEHHSLDWHNCYVFGNGAESDRIRDDFNENQFDNGVKASTVLAERIEEERRKNGLIYSGIYNSNSGVNDTNQFIAGEKITKDIEPSFGSIQKLHTRNTNLLTLCEDKIVKILADKDALFNADGNTNVTATNKVLGAADAYKGNFGISTNPESFIASPYQVYFADPVRGQICGLSGEGVRSISDIGMKDYFADLLKDNVHRVIGSYDAKKKEYNVTVEEKYRKKQLVPTTTTISYSETKKGWVSFKSFAQEMGTSLNNNYYTFNGGALWKHHENETRNNFYGAQYASTIELLFNDNSTAVKSFGSINYEGTQAKTPQFTTVSHVNTWNGDESDSDGTTTTNFTDGEYYNLTASTGWYVTNVNTDLQISDPLYFKDKEGKWFGQIRGSDEGIDNLNSTWKLKEFSSQGLGVATITHSSPSTGEKGRYTIKNNTSTTYQGDDGSGGAWDSTADSLVDVAYSVNTANVSTQVGVATGAVTANLTITNIVNGVYSGYPLSASDFSCPNKDSEVNSVTFTDNGTAGDPANTVNVAVLLNDTTPTSGNFNQDIFIDIDSTVKHEGVREDRDVCFKTIITQQSNSTITESGTVPNITKSTVSAGSTFTSTHTGSIAETDTLIASIQVQAAGGYFIQGNNINSTLLNLGTYANFYTVSSQINANTNGLATTMLVQVRYNPPTFGSLAVDPPNICDLNHQVRLSYKIAQIQAAVTNTITDVIVNKTNLDSLASSSLITVKGVPGTQYGIAAVKMASVGSGSAHGTNPHYNFDDAAFQSGESVLTGTIGSNGQNIHQLGLDDHTTDAQYDIKITSVASSTLASAVPTAFGDLSIIKRADKRIEITPATSTASNFGTLPSAVTVTRRHRTDDLNFDFKGYYCYAQGSTETRGASKGAAGTRFVLNETEKSSKIKQGMHVFGTGVASGCTVVEVRNKYITLSATSTIADAKLLFIDLGSRFTRLSFTITPGTARTLAVNSSNTVLSQLANPTGFSSSTKTVNGEVSSGTAIVLDDVDGLGARLTVSGTNISGGTTISSVDETNKTITLSQAVGGTVSDGATLTFGGGLGEQTSIIHESVTKVGSNIIIEAVLSVENLDSTVSTTLNIDNLINVS